MRGRIGAAVSVFVFVGAAVACGAFGTADDDGASPGGGNSADAGGAADAGAEGAAPLEGTVMRTFSFQPIPAQPRVMHDTTLRVKLTIVRTDATQGDVVVTVSGLSAGVTAEPLTSMSGEDSGELAVSVAASAKQGPFDATVEGAVGRLSASTTLPLFVRGKPGTDNSRLAHPKRGAVSAPELSDAHRDLRTPEEKQET
jgi:hypothetical protein